MDVLKLGSTTVNQVNNRHKSHSNTVKLYQVKQTKKDMKKFHLFYYENHKETSYKRSQSKRCRHQCFVKISIRTFSLLFRNKFDPSLNRFFLFFLTKPFCFRTLTQNTTILNNLRNKELNRIESIYVVSTETLHY